MKHQDNDFYEDWCDQSGIVEDSNGVVHYYDEDGIEVETYYPEHDD